MPEPSPKAQPPILYGPDCIETLRRAGAEFIEFWCVGGRADGRKCEHRKAVRISDIIAKLGPEISLIMLARRARCERCGKRGCHVQPSAPISRVSYGYRDWLRGEMERCQQFLIWAREQL
ncbi:hypothetical protein [Azospirillum picis]|uniref:Uncharacterized protein n=1 Tax=Azospirillum picis TaxID=488438 RepID=A0ABU0MUK3_9PROT|nr:hypothetical protein [Azospirillum picis]MBP2303345.1 hypothetical protein [Azospirillum picis]MDQ0537173.1 hypothetical protein [Azospirillum picis]